MGDANIKGRGSTFKFMVMTDLTKDANGNFKRPADFDTNALTFEEATTTDVNIAHDEEQAEENSPTYVSAAPGQGESWKDPEPGAGGWNITFTGHVQDNDTERAAMNAAKDAQIARNMIWIERVMVTETKPGGGACFIASANFPVPVNAIVTYTMNFTGRKKWFWDTSTATVAT